MTNLQKALALLPDLIERSETQAQKMVLLGAYRLASFGPYDLWEHPLRGDSAPVYMTTPDGRWINTGFYDLGDFEGAGVGLELCKTIAFENR